MKRIKSCNVEVFNTELIYSQFMCLQSLAMVELERVPNNLSYYQSHCLYLKGK